MTLERNWFPLALIAGLVELAAFCFLGYISWAFCYSATLGLSSRTQETRLADHVAWMFLCMFIVLEVFSAIVVGFGWESPDLGSAWLRFSARYGLALLLSLLATGVVVGLWLASGRFTESQVRGVACGWAHPDQLERSIAAEKPVHLHLDVKNTCAKGPVPSANVVGEVMRSWAVRQ